MPNAIHPLDLFDLDNSATYKTNTVQISYSYDYSGKLISTSTPAAPSPATSFIPLFASQKRPRPLRCIPNWHSVTGLPFRYPTLRTVYQTILQNTNNTRRATGNRFGLFCANLFLESFMASPVVVFATVVAKQDCVDQVLDTLKSLIPPTLVEQGCINYDLHRQNDDPNTFIFHETWESLQHLDAHMQTKHFIEANDNLSNITESVTVVKTTKV